MTVKEFLNKTENMIISDYDLNEETGFVEVKFGRDIYGGVNYVFENNGALIFSATPKNNNPRWYENAHKLDLSEIRELCKGHENLELYYYSKSNGIFSVKSVTLFEYDYSDDGDGHYEACNIKCSAEPVAKSLNDIEKINIDDYEDFFESSMENKYIGVKKMNYKKIFESNLKEDVSEPTIEKGETLSNLLKEISNWIGSIWEKELPKGAWRTERILNKVRGFKIYSKGIGVIFSFVDEDGDTDGHMYEATLEDWLSKRHFIKAK